MKASPNKKAVRRADADTALIRLSEEACALPPGDIEAAQRLFAELCNAGEHWLQTYIES